MKISCQEPTAWCPSACPATKPHHGAACAISERINCEYATGFCITGDTELLDTSCSCVLGHFNCYNYCSSNEGGFTENSFMVVEAQPPVEEVPIPKIFVEESPSESPSESPTFSDDAEQVNEHHGGKNGGKKKDKKEKMNSRKLGGRLNRGAAGGDETFIAN